MDQMIDKQKYNLIEDNNLEYNLEYNLELINYIFFLEIYISLKASSHN
jgi:hypothetical protein